MLRLLAQPDDPATLAPDAQQLRDLLLQAADQLEGKAPDAPPSSWMRELLSDADAGLDERGRRLASCILSDARADAAGRHHQTRTDLAEVFGALDSVDAADEHLESALALLGVGLAARHVPAVEQPAELA